MGKENFVGAGGTPGGAGQFLIGLIMAGVGAYLLLNQVEVTTSGWHFGGFNAFGLSLLPMLLGVGMLFFNGKSLAGWILLTLGFAIIIAGILMNMDIYFRRTSLYNTLVMLVLLAGGLGLIAKSLRPQKSEAGK
jgi:uncharacterized protein